MSNSGGGAPLPSETHDSLEEDSLIWQSCLGSGGFTDGVHRIKADRPMRLRSGALLQTHVFALKVAQNSADAELLLQNEFAVLSHLSHESVPYVVDKICRRGPRMTMLMEFVHGLDLDALITLRYSRSSAASTYFPPVASAYVHVACKLSAALAYLEREDFAHNDVKNENIVLNCEDLDDVNFRTKVKLIDYGFARNDGAVPGYTAEYCAPEKFHYILQRNSTKKYAFGAQSDCFSLGCVLYAMATGKQVYRDSTCILADNTRISWENLSTHLDADLRSASRDIQHGRQTLFGNNEKTRLVRRLLIFDASKRMKAADLLAALTS